MKKLDELNQKKVPEEELTADQKIEVAKAILVSLEKIGKITQKYPNHPDHPKK